jgi:uncharacterized protein
MAHAFQQFQHEFARHIRDPRGSPRPPGVPARRMAIYNELLYNNLEGFLIACFPVSRSILGERRWPRVVRAFFREWRSHTPYFREIPREFVRWLNEGVPPMALAPWLRELAHYEWTELAVDVMAVETPPCAAAGDLLAGRPVLNPALMNLGYAWPVHRISPAWRPRKPRETRLLVFRDESFEVRFAELNPVSARLLALLQQEAVTGRAACLRVAAELKHPDPEVVVAHGAALLEQLRSQGAILGVRT